MAGDSEDKQWAKKYLLDPFTEPEPSQETGPGTSFYNPQRSLSMRAKPVSSGHSRNSSYPTPPHSANSTHDSFHPSNPFSGSSRASSSHERGDWAPAGTILGRSSSINSRNSGYNPRSPTHQSQRDTSDFGRSKTVRYPPQTHHTQVSSSKEPGLYRSTSAASGGIQRRGSLNQRYPGDMSHKPLDMLKQDHRSVERKHRRQKSKNPPVDTIDALDKSFGGSYHHSGPYDATLAASNINKKYSPLEAVKDTNMEAIKATPQAYINDSLVKHVPLQGTATVPPGEMDIGGRFMEYEEGADLMREPSAGGGAYKRWDGVSYLPDDYKGKGEPSFTYERDLKEKQARSHRHTRSQGNGPIEYEMQPTGHRRSSGKNGEYTVRQRSVSAAAEGAGPSSRLEVPMSPNSPKGFSTNNDIRRHNSTGKRISDGLKRRFGSIRRKKDIEQEV